jgi:phage-related protein
MAIFTYTPDFGAQVQIKPRVRAVSFGDGYQQRQADGINTQPQVWSLQWQNRDNSETAAIKSFLATRSGVEAFDWTPPNEATAIRVVCGEWSVQTVKFNLNTVSAQFKQVFEP